MVHFRRSLAVCFAVIATFGAQDAVALASSNGTTELQEATTVNVTTPLKPNPEGNRTSHGHASDTSGSVLAVRVKLELPERCGTLAQFVERLHARLPGMRFVESEAAPTVLARISSAADGTYRATMMLSHPDGRAASRIVAANSCDEAIDALTLVTAVTLEPLGVAPEPRGDAKVSAVPQPAPTAPSGSNTPRPLDGNELRSAPAPRALPTLKQAVFGVGASWTSMRGPTPGWLNGVELTARAKRDSESGISPSIRIGLSYATKRGVAARGGLADFGVAALAIDLCPWRRTWPMLELRSCGLLLGGVVAARGRATEAPESHTRPWFAFGATAEVEFLMHRAIALPIRLLVAFPASRDRYAFDPEAFYRVPVVTVGLTVGLEARFR